MDLLISLVINGLATGMLIFLLAAGLTLIFGLMSVLNFAHGGLFIWGAYTGVWVFQMSNSFILGIIAAISIGLLLGLVTERLIVRPVYGNHIQQILITLGFMLVLQELIKVVFGPDQKAVFPPDILAGSFIVGDIVLIKYRLFIIAIGILIFVISTIILKKSRIGLIVRAGVMDKEMIQSLGINIKLVFMLVFMVGAGLAGLSGVLHSVYSGVIYAEMGLEFSILAFIVVVIGGMGSFSGSLFAAILVGLAQAFMAYYVPALSLAVNMLLMTIVLIFRPQGLFQVKG
ncbi:branched-chain amino acid ABC transporter permease [Oceanobacillus profundus]|uniref:Branched-chain amino acid ABC transporter permease n=1 Tax=Oceanobacillus profundus TaxID=372463 RepID=A0A417YBK5_9BACI|nr:branched-chain amino acid ABC transporter permease [Oceanobacillus profundus]MBR3121188.1 branched-chain amino acid ABC transporter permease [Oceanobacillus sp.]MCM3397835.1 branched-chain amino acid ABC transporter permease [Oceanobacillus profundus]PAE28056.1 branched-chain amino acid ABC transporter permease [Paenibacillus sp. 7884-2]RHW30068.1 branched-chain amino acid ABC transporter permease [Oceanobacillus profundus]